MSSNQLELFEIFYEEPDDGLECIKCGLKKDISQFYTLSYKDSDHKPEVKRTCKSCKKNLIKVIKDLKNKIPYPSQDYECPICERTIQEIGKYGQPKLQTWYLDHCHNTNTFRGWICHHCNTGIGSLGDNPKRVEKALNYLKKHLTSE